MAVFRDFSLMSRYRAEYGGYLLLKTLLRILPFSLMMKNGDRIGNWVFRVIGVKQYIARANLRYAFGDRYRGEPIEVLSRRMNGHLFKTLLELANMDRILARPDTAFRFPRIEILRDALRENRGVLLATGHFGNFELGALALAQQGIPISLVVKKVRNPYIDRELTSLRRGFGAEINPVEDAGRLILSALKRNRVVCMLSDQDFGLIRGILVEFFGHPTSTPTGTARFAVQTRAPIIPVHVYREDSGIQVIEAEPPLEVNYARDARETEIPRITQEVTSILERWIRERPEQYFWLHRRWKSTPDGQWLYRKRA